MFNWPHLELTDYERRFVRIYKTKDKPGVLRRIYKVVLNSPAQPNSNLPTEKLTDKIQISRRARVFALNFSGNTDAWRLQITNASGTLFTLKTPRTFLDPIVSSMTCGNLNNAVSLGGLTPPLVPNSVRSDGIGPALDLNLGCTVPTALTEHQPFPLLIDPNWLLLPNESLIFTGTPIPIDFNFGKSPETPNLTLTIGIHVWEFPGMERAVS